MKLKLNKYDIIVTIVIIVITLGLLWKVLNTNSTSKDKIANVYYQNKLVHSFDLTKKELKKYEIDATNGLVKIEAKNGKVRVVSETSKNNICSIQGWSDSITNPIVCLPNNLYIKIVSAQQENNSDVDVFIK